MERKQKKWQPQSSNGVGIPLFARRSNQIYGPLINVQKDSPIYFTGILLIRELPRELDDTQEYMKWYPRMSERERDRYTVLEARNLLTNAGRTQLLTFAGASGTTTAFAQYYSVGTGPIYVAQSSDTTLSSELYRAVPNSSTIVGNGVTISTQFTTTQAVGTYTNSGIWGNGATGTSGSGTLMTHLLYNYTKTNTVTVSNDYLISLT